MGVGRGCLFLRCSSKQTTVPFRGYCPDALPGYHLQRRQLAETALDSLPYTEYRSRRGFVCYAIDPRNNRISGSGRGWPLWYLWHLPVSPSLAKTNAYFRLNLYYTGTSIWVTFIGRGIVPHCIDNLFNYLCVPMAEAAPTLYSLLTFLCLLLFPSNVFHSYHREPLSTLWLILSFIFLQPK